MSNFIHIFRLPGSAEAGKVRALKTGFPTTISELSLEYCFNIELLPGRSLSNEDKSKLLWLLTETFEPELVREEGGSFLTVENGNAHQAVLEVGPRLAFSTAWSSNCISMLQACGLNCISRIERSRRYKFVSTQGNPLTAASLEEYAAKLHDRMTECVYTTPLMSFDNGVHSEPVQIIPVLEEGKSALDKLNKAKGLGFDDWDLDFYTDMFVTKLKRNPTDVECFDLGQSNSEHSRHWYFGGKMIIDGVAKPETLFQMVKSTLPKSGPGANSIIAFHDNSSAIQGCDVNTLTPSDPSTASAMAPNRLVFHPILTAETHNFPSGVAPFPGAETGTGGRLRDVQATGRGAHTLAGISAYCVGNLHMPHNALPWEEAAVAEDKTMGSYPSNLAPPLRIEIEASNGASDYGNKYGEPVVTGFTRSFGQRLPDGSRVEWIKPIMFTAGVGMMDGRHSSKNDPEEGMIICKVGGPAYRIGMGGGAASSRVQGTADAALDFDAVQRGDAEMENRMNRVIRACIELGARNPIVSIHDQGAGGNGNVLKEIVDPLGARLTLKNIPVGDPTLSVMELWGAEYQENDAFLVKPEDLPLVMQVSARENCPVSPVGVVTGDGRVVAEAADGSTPFDLPLSLVLGKMPQKEFTFATPTKVLRPLVFPADITPAQALGRVLRLLDVCSKRFLVNKVDRSVTGLVAQQQCVGPLHTPLADVAVLAQSHFSTTGVAVAVGEQPVKGLINHAAQARMTVCEALSNLVFADLTDLAHTKASGNWMWAAKLPGEGANMYDACAAMRDCLVQLGVGIDGGKDSLSMAAKVAGETVKSPGEVTLTCYCTCRDIRNTVTPDFKYPGESVIVYVDLGEGYYRLGGTALSTVYTQLGDECPDASESAIHSFKRAFNTTQTCLRAGWLKSGHDRSDGGLITTLLEMAFAGNCGLDVTLSEAWHTQGASSNSSQSKDIPSYLPILFGEELGFVFEVLRQDADKVVEAFQSAQCDVKVIGTVTVEKTLTVRMTSADGAMTEILPLDPYQNQPSTNKVERGVSMVLWRSVWESTSTALEQLQCDLDCVAQESAALAQRITPPYKVAFASSSSPSLLADEEEVLRLAAASTSNSISTERPKVAILRQEGTNGDREMCSAFHAAGFEAWDVNMNDLLSGSVTLDRFRGVVFCGGFSYADVNDSAKGWAGVIKFNPNVLRQFEAFRQRSDTFSLGVCNGCQLMALLGWVPFPDQQVQFDTSSGNNSNSNSSSSTGPEIFDASKQARFVHNTSGRFESRWSTVKILPSKSVLLKGMEGSTLGVWLAHGEGKAYFPDTRHLHAVLQQQLAPIRYVDDDNEPTEEYPFNPNGSPEGIAALCSTDGRHLALMPHPERCFLKWQIPYLPEADKAALKTAPWLRLFQNAKTFCDGN